MNCDYCKKHISGTYFYNFWGDKYHTRHTDEGNNCISCNSLIMPKMGSLKIDKTSEICSRCAPEAILHLNQMEQCIKAVFEFYKMGEIYFKKNKIKFELVSKKELPKNTLGLYTYSKGEFTIKALKGLNKAIFCGVITHELMHVHLKMLNINILLPEEEGLCEVARYFTLKTIGGQISNAAIRIMEESNDPIYGYGFRLIRKQIIAMGGNMQKYLAKKTTSNNDNIEGFIYKNINDILNYIT